MKLAVRSAAVFGSRGPITHAHASTSIEMVRGAMPERINRSYAVYASVDSPGKRNSYRIKKEERRILIELFVTRYRAENNGHFPTVSLTRKEVGGSYYVVRRIVQEIIYNVKNSGTSGVGSMSTPYTNLSTEPKSHTLQAQQSLLQSPPENRHTNAPEKAIEETSVFKESKKQPSSVPKTAEKELQEQQYNRDLSFSRKEEHSVVHHSSSISVNQDQHYNLADSLASISNNVNAVDKEIKGRSIFQESKEHPSCLPKAAGNEVQEQQCNRDLSYSRKKEHSVVHHDSSISLNPDKLDDSSDSLASISINFNTVDKGIEERSIFKESKEQCPSLPKSSDNELPEEHCNRHLSPSRNEEHSVIYHDSSTSLNQDQHSNISHSLASTYNNAELNESSGDCGRELGGLETPGAKVSIQGSTDLKVHLDYAGSNSDPKEERESCISTESERQKIMHENKEEDLATKEDYVKTKGDLEEIKQDAFENISESEETTKLKLNTVWENFRNMAKGIFSFWKKH